MRRLWSKGSTMGIRKPWGDRLSRLRWYPQTFRCSHNNDEIDHTGAPPSSSSKGVLKHEAAALSGLNQAQLECKVDHIERLPYFSFRWRSCGVSTKERTRGRYHKNIGSIFPQEPPGFLSISLKPQVVATTSNRVTNVKIHRPSTSKSTLSSSC